MPMTPKKQTGFTALEGVIITVVVILLGLAGWWVFNQTQKDQAATDETTQMQAETAPQIDQADDLENAEQYIQNLDLDNDLNTSEIDETLTY